MRPWRRRLLLGRWSILTFCRVSGRSWLIYKIETELQEPAGTGSDCNRPALDLARNYLHGVPWLDPHHRHRDAPPDQQDAGRSLKPELGGACCDFCGCCACSGGDASATFGLGRQSEESSDGRGAPLTVSASHGARGTLADGLTSLSRRRLTGGGAGVGLSGSKGFFAAIGRLPRCAGGSSGMSPFSR